MLVYLVVIQFSADPVCVVQLNPFFCYCYNVSVRGSLFFLYNVPSIFISLFLSLSVCSFVMKTLSRASVIRRMALNAWKLIRVSGQEVPKGFITTTKTSTFQH